MHRSQHSGLAFLRLCLIFIALCLVLAQVEVATRNLHDQTTGLPNPWLPRDPLPPPQAIPFLGVSLDPNSLSITSSITDTITQFETLADAGFGWVRVRVAWDQVEPTPRAYAWATLDRTLEALAAANLTPVLLLDGSPTWARDPRDRAGDTGHLAPPADPATFAHFAQSVAARYGDQVRYYQIWDEPNIAPHWGARRIEAAEYARLLKAAATALRATDDDAYIITAALAPTADRGHLAQDEVYFLNRLYAAGAASAFDAVAIQPFGFAQRPNDSRVGVDALNFHRTLLIRQAMLEAGDGDTGLWLMRFGWHRTPNVGWQSVTAAQQRVYTFDALATAYRQWPWVVGMGWPVGWSVDDTPGDASMAGFALTPELVATFQTAETTLLAHPRPQQTAQPPLSAWTPLALWLVTILLLIWRAIAAAARLPWQRWATQWAARPRWQQVIAWAILLLLYHLATWPPLLLLYALVAALGLYAQPRLGLALALLLLPLYAYHKEFTWLGQTWRIPPTQAVLLCLLPALWHTLPKLRAQWRGIDRWHGIAIGWLLVMLLSATGVWYWPAYGVGMLNLVIAPLLLFGLLRAWVTTRQEAEALLVALTAGGVLIAVVGLLVWLQGRGTEVDGMRRLTGLGFSANQTALYLLRTFALTIGLALATRHFTQWLWLLMAALVGGALLLTGSRGALLLGLPIGALFFISRHQLRLPPRRYLLFLLPLAASPLALVAWQWRDRLGNLASIFARMEGWRVALQLWLDHWLFGVGPDGFWWTFPAYLGPLSDADPNLRHPHLVWLEFATSGGILAVAWLMIVGIMLFHWERQKQNTLSWRQVGLLAGLLAALAHAQVDAFQALPELAGWNWAALALLLALDRGSNQE